MELSDYETLCEELNGGDAIDSATLLVLLNIAKVLVEQQRDWMRLKATDSSLSITTASTWQTPYSLAGITGFSRFEGDYPVKIWDGANRIDHLKQVPFNDRLLYRERSDTFVYDAKNNQIYINGTRTFGGTILIHHIALSPDIDDDTSWEFPSWAHPLLAFFAVGVHKGGIDYDDVNARMAPENRSIAQALLGRLIAEDAKLQEQEISQYDPYESSEDSFRPNAINIDR